MRCHILVFAHDISSLVCPSSFLQPNSYSSSKTAQAYCPIGNLPWSPRAGLNSLPLGFPATLYRGFSFTNHDTLHLSVTCLLPTPDVKIMKTGSICYSSSYPHLLGKASGTQKALYNDLSSWTKQPQMDADWVLPNVMADSFGHLANMDWVPLRCQALF